MVAAVSFSALGGGSVCRDWVAKARRTSGEPGGVTSLRLPDRAGARVRHPAGGEGARYSPWPQRSANATSRSGRRGGRPNFPSG